jgi:hypothetical protein
MRLFEVDQGSARDVLAVLKGLADKNQKTAELPFPTVLNILRPFGLGIATPDGLIALKNNVDPNGSVIKDIMDDGTVILNTEVPDPKDQKQTQASGGPSVDKMAKSNSKNLKPDL